MKIKLILIAALCAVSAANAQGNVYDLPQINKVTESIKAQEAVKSSSVVTDAKNVLNCTQKKQICGDLKAAANVVNAEGQCRGDTKGNIWGFIPFCCAKTAAGGKDKKTVIMECIHRAHNDEPLSCFDVDAGKCK